MPRVSERPASGVVEKVSLVTHTIKCRFGGVAESRMAYGKRDLGTSCIVLELRASYSSLCGLPGEPDFDPIGPRLLVAVFWHDEC